MDRRSFIRLSGAGTASVSAIFTAASASPSAAASRGPHRAASHSFSNPVLGRGADPGDSVVYDTQTRLYYFIQTLPGNIITVRRSRSLRSLSSAPNVVVWEGGRDGSPCCEWWGPELHKINGKWFIYVAADNGNNLNHRMQVLESEEPQGPYAYKGELALPNDKWAIDGTVAQVPGKGLYFLWSGLPSDTVTVQNLYIARMTNPWTVTGDRVLLSTPTYPWERHTPNQPVQGINEGPAMLVHDGKIFVSYSASACWTPDYSVGLLSADIGSDLLSQDSWTKSPAPVFESNKKAEIYGTGGVGFFTSPNGQETWFVYHATHDPDGNCGLKREVYAQQLTWSSDGTPEFGTPLPLTTEIRLPAGDPGVHP